MPLIIIPKSVSARGTVICDITLEDGTVVANHGVNGVTLEDRESALAYLKQYAVAFQAGKDAEKGSRRSGPTAIDADLGKPVNPRAARL